ncbi:SOUL family heme-binding protein [Lacihabitans lacunae]|uniref:SOUL family heme-binding protein n=1 Tax=Lacihabitans lacunae TaxID=1028214 RepID=A0ABV7Z1D2_9BACT
MKIALIVFGVFALVFIVVQIFAMKSRKSIENYPYEVLKTYDEFEIRKYEARLFTKVQLNTNDYSQASSAGFSKLAGYIFGGNDSKQKIAMTSPVAMGLEDSMTMMFMVPNDLDKSKLPKPDNSEIEFKEEPVKIVAAITFGGWANTEKIEKYKQMLIDGLNQKGINYTNHFSLLGYNPPFDVLNRKNEVIVELEEGFLP